MHCTSVLRLSVLLIFNNLYVSGASCPYEGIVEKWSEESTWPDGKKPQENANVTITKPILLDESPPELFSITIEEGGQLVWSPLTDISMRIHYILIRGGRMDIGAERCKHKAKATITLIGERGDYSIEGFDEKFIGVAENGTLELHGKKKLAWTKLTKTVHKLDKEHGLIFRHQDQSDIKEAVSGIQVHVFDKNTGKSEQSRLYPMLFKAQSQLDRTVEKMKTFLDDIPKGKVVAMAIQRRIVNHDLSELYDVIEEFAYGSTKGEKSKLRKIKINDAWAMVTLKGNPSKTAEVLTQRTNQMGQVAKATLMISKKKKKFDSICYIHNTVAGGSYVDFISSDTDFSLPVLNVVDDVSKWKPGDILLLTSTDFDWEQAEKAEVVSCKGCTKFQIRVELFAKYTHYGEIYKNVDMRGEVALLSRNILIQGETTDAKQFGGHTKYLKGFDNVHIEGVEFTSMGQQTDLGRYPIHFHFCEDVDTYDDPPYIRQNSIHHTFARCTTIHATHGVTLTDNVCYDTLGHGYFLEDGGEKRTIFDGNLGAGQRPGKLILADREPSTFWITNPQTYVRNNVAAGGQGKGYWLTYPDIPLAESADKGYMQDKEARHTALYQFYNNVAHSNRVSGLFIDNILHNNTEADGYNRYEPWQDPFNETSGAKAVYLNKFTGYKNRIQNVWIRGGLFKCRHFSLSDSLKSLQFLRENKQEQYLLDSVIIGDSANLGEPSQYWNNVSYSTFYRSLPTPNLSDSPRQGIRFFSGPTLITNIWFDGFNDTELYWSAALTLRNTIAGFSTPRHLLSGLEFGYSDPENGNRVKGHEKILSDIDDDYIATMRDVDGSVTSVPGSQIVPIHPFFMTPSCVVRKNWNMAYCPHLYGLLFVRGNKNEDILALREDNPDAVDVSSDGVDKNSKFLVVLNETISYTVFWKTEVPKVFILTGWGVTRSSALRVGVCVPRNATLNIQGFDFPVEASRMHHWTRVNSTSDVESDENGVTYFYDSEVGILFVKLRHQRDRLPGDQYDCPGFVCARVIVTVTEGDLEDIDCIERAYPKEDKRSMSSEFFPPPPWLHRKTAPMLHKWRRRGRFGRQTTVLPATSADPPVDWGAGSTRPFSTAVPVDNW